MRLEGLYLHSHSYMTTWIIPLGLHLLPAGKRSFTRKTVCLIKSA